MKKEWKELITEDCPDCGSTLMIFSSCLAIDDKDGYQWANDGDDVKCTECNFVSCMTADEDSFYVQDGNIDELNDEETA